MKEEELGQDFLELLVCPIGLSKLELEGKTLRCKRCETRFPIEEGGVPNLLMEAAELPPQVASYEELACWKERQKASPERASPEQ